MGILDPEPVTTMTAPHRRLVELLELIGLQVEVEASFPPKFVDCYLPAYHVAFEADGPQHAGTKEVGVKDKARDDYLMGTYALPVVHVRSTELIGSQENVMANTFIALLRTGWGESVKDRRLFAREVGGWDGG